MEIKVIEPKKKLLERLRVCAYCRVSTEEDEQANSLENQITHYEESIQANPGYELVGIYVLHIQVIRFSVFAWLSIQDWCNGGSNLAYLNPFYQLTQLPYSHFLF